MRNGALATEKIADRTRRDLVDILRVLEMEIRRRLGQLDTERGKLVSTREALKTANDVRAEVVLALKKLGVAAVRDVMLERMIEAVRQETIGLGAVIDADARPAIKAIFDGSTGEVAELFKFATDEIRQAINKGITTNAPLDDVIMKISERMSITVGQAATVVDTAIMGAGRTAIVGNAKKANKTRTKIDGLELEPFYFMLVGPDDPKTRPFCDKWLNVAISEKKLDSLRNGQIEPPAVHCGGYNCRHSWAPVTRNEAEGLGIKIYD
jgi:hypothetical protein